MDCTDREIVKLIINRLTKEQLTQLIRENNISNDDVYIVKAGQESYNAIPTIDNLDKSIIEHDLNPQAHSNLRYIHDQESASDKWEINHNLNREPSVTIVDTSNNVVMGCITYIDKNNIEIYFNSPFKGKAYLS